jgi:hypothetical protein
MLSSEGRWRSRWLGMGSRLAIGLCFFVLPGCLLVQPLDDVKDEGDAGEAGKGGSSATGGSSTGGKGGSATGGTGGGATGGAGGATGGSGGVAGGSAGKGGSDSGGASGKGGASGASGAAGGGNTGGTLVYGPVWTFDDDVQGFAVGYSEPPALGVDSSATHSTAEGEPDDGSVEVTIPFDGPDQTVELGVTLPAPFDFTGKTLAARVRLDSGFFGNTPEPGGVKIFVKTGDAFAYADGAWSDLVPGEWITAVFDLDSPDYDGGIDPRDVRELGVAFKSTSAPDAGWTTATLYVDTVGWVGAERPPCILDPLLLDDMETDDGIGWTCQTNGRAGGWYVYDDMTDGTRSPAGSPAMFPLEDIDVPRGSSSAAVHVTGGGYTGFGGGVGMSFVPGNLTQATYWDASGYAGISFWARGSGTMFVQAVLANTRFVGEDYPGLCEPTLQFNCNDNYVSNPFTLTATWTEYVIPFATMSQEGWGQPVPWSYDLNAVEFRWATDEDFDFWIDDVRLLARECDDGDAVQCSADGDKCSRGTLVPTACNTECSKRGYTGSTCSAAAGCACDTPTDPNLAGAIDAFCQCAGPTLDCTPEGRALMEALASDPQQALSSVISCYGGYTAPAECELALMSCWGT